MNVMYDTTYANVKRRMILCLYLTLVRRAVA